MTLAAIAEIRMETLGDDVGYVFPARPLGKIRWIGLVLVGFGVLFISMPARTLVEFLQQVRTGHGDVGQGIFALFLIPFVVAGLVPMGIGLFIIWGRCRVDWCGRRLSVVDYVGPLRWRRRLPKDPIQKFKVMAGGTRVNGQRVTSGPLLDLAGLAMEYETGKPRLLVLGYPRDWLEALAQDLSGRVGLSAARLAGGPVVEVVEAGDTPPEFLDEPQKPAGSAIRIENGPNGLVIEIPPAGLRKGTMGMFSFAICWCVFMVVFTGLIAFVKITKPGEVPGAFLLFIAGFWLVGLAMLSGAINMGRRHATLRVDPDGLHLSQTGIFGTKSSDWRTGDIAMIRADGSGMAVNDVPVIELQIHPVHGKKAGFFAGRADDELRWLAAELRRALRIPAQPEPPKLGPTRRSR